MHLSRSLTTSDKPAACPKDTHSAHQYFKHPRLYLVSSIASSRAIHLTPLSQRIAAKRARSLIQLSFGVCSVCEVLRLLFNQHDVGFFMMAYIAN